jgi:uncharacterized phage-associated protein
MKYGVVRLRAMTIAPFDERKAAEAAAVLLRANDGSMNYMKLIKELYIADRRALLDWGRSITSDRYVAMKHGPVLSNVLDLIHFGSKTDWSAIISDNQNYELGLRADFQDDDIEELSDAEINLLNNVALEFRDEDPWSIVDRLHDELPEWHDPGQGALEISISDILRAGGKQDEHIEAINQELSRLDRRNAVPPNLDAAESW